MNPVAENSPDRAPFEASLTSALEALSLALPGADCELLWRHFQLVVETNRRFNLTRITAPGDAAVKHYADSLTLLASPLVEPEKALRVLDVGTGAGFPAIPLAIAAPVWRITAIDGTGKKANFVGDAAARLGLRNVQAIHARAADLARSRPKAFDLVLLRAVTQLEPGLREIHRLLARGGKVIFYKTANLDPEERRLGEGAGRELGLQGPDQWEVSLSAGADGEPLRRVLLSWRSP